MKKEGNCEIALWGVWLIASASITWLVAQQSYEGWSERTKDYMTMRIVIASLLVTPNVGILAGVGRIKGNFASLLSSGAIIAVCTSVLYSVLVFLFFYLEPRYYPGQLTDGFSVVYIALSVGQAMVAWSLTRLASR
jgi:hypothetical protein